MDRFDRQSGQLTHYQNDPDDFESLSSDDVFVICQDHLGIVWLGTGLGGLNPAALLREIHARQNDLWRLING